MKWLMNLYDELVHDGELRKLREEIRDLKLKRESLVKNTAPKPF